MRLGLENIREVVNDPEVMFLAHEVMLYPRGTYPLDRDNATERDPEARVAPFPFSLYLHEHMSGSKKKHSRLAMACI